jgi:hypothetical protein
MQMTEDVEPLLIRHTQAQRLLGIGPSAYFQLIREGKIKAVGERRTARAYYPSIQAYVAGLLDEAAAKRSAA